MFNKLFSNKKNILLLILTVLSILSILWIFFTTSKRKVIPPSPAPNIKFELIRTIPENGSKDLSPNTSALEFDFSKPIEISTLVMNSVPKTDLLFETDNEDKILYIRALNGWEIGTSYTITINVSSKDKDNLQNKIIFNFESNFPKSSLMDEVPR